MRKKLIIFILAVFMCITVAGCNQQIIDTTWKYDKAIIQLPNGEIVEGEVESWKDYDNSDQIQVKIKNGDSYLVHSSNVVLIAE